VGYTLPQRRRQVPFPEERKPRILLNGDFTFCLIRDFNELDVAKKSTQQLLRDQLYNEPWTIARTGRLFVLRASTDVNIDEAFATLSEKRAGALLVGADTFFYSRPDKFAQSHRCISSGGASIPAGFSKAINWPIYQCIRQQKVELDRVGGGRRADRRFSERLVTSRQQGSLASEASR
jgi:hypothetical protein